MKNTTLPKTAVDKDKLVNFWRNHKSTQVLAEMVAIDPAPEESFSFGFYGVPQQAVAQQEVEAYKLKQ